MTSKFLHNEEIFTISFFQISIHELEKNEMRNQKMGSATTFLQSFWWYIFEFIKNSDEILVRKVNGFSYTNLMLVDQLECQILNLDLWLVCQHEIHGGYFDLMITWQVRYLRCQDSYQFFSKWLVFEIILIGKFRRHLWGKPFSLY